MYLRWQELMLEPEFVHHISHHARKQLLSDEGVEFVVVVPEFHRSCSCSGRLLPTRTRLPDSRNELFRLPRYSGKIAVLRSCRQASAHTHGDTTGMNPFRHVFQTHATGWHKRSIRQRAFHCFYRSEERRVGKEC